MLSGNLVMNLPPVFGQQFLNEESNSCLESGDLKRSDKVCSEITVIVKDSEKTLREKFLIYEAYSVHHDDPVIGVCVAKTVKSFAGEPESVKIRINMEL